MHTVRAGDSLWTIAAAHRIELAVIVRWNPGVNARRLVAGERILVPGGTPAMRSPGVPGGRSRAPTPTASHRSTPAPAPRAPSVLRANGAPAPAPSRLPRRPGHLWPLPVDGQLTTRFSSAHLGIDVAAPSGTPVRAVAAGRVAWAGWKNDGGGFVVVIDHGDGMISTYNHNRAVAVRVGQSVAAGQTIAWVGATGRATGPHLDFRVEMGGRYVDPLTLY